MYGKIENGGIVYAPKTLVAEGKRVINPSAQLLQSLGYKAVSHEDYPDDGKHYKQVYQETDTEIRCVWVEDESEYWENIPYDEAVNAEIRKRYTESQEFALLRQRDEKPDEYEQYYDYCESCKAYVKQKKEEYGWQ